MTPTPYEGLTLAIYSDTGGGKTTQAGEWAKHVAKTRKKKTVIHSSDMGGFDSIRPLVNLGVILTNQFKPESDDPWIWINDAVSGTGLGDDVGAVVFDSGTSQGEALLKACAQSDFQIGQQRTQKFTVSRGEKNLTVSSNNEVHYGIVQNFLLDAIWKSTWLTRRGIDVIWTFSTHRSEEQDRTPIIGPKLAGKALTAAIPKWFRYTFYLASVPQEGASPTHRLYLSEHPELAGLGHSFGNARNPIDGLELPPYVEPASVSEAIKLIEASQSAAEDKLREELGM